MKSLSGELITIICCSWRAQSPSGKQMEADLLHSALGVSLLLFGGGLLAIGTSRPALAPLHNAMPPRPTHGRGLRCHGAVRLEVDIPIGTAAAGLNISRYALIQSTNSLFAAVAGNFKVAIVVCLSALFLNDILKPWNIAGVGVTVLAFCCHTVVMRREKAKAQAAGGSGGGKGVKLGELTRATLSAMALAGLLFIGLCGYFLWLGSVANAAKPEKVSAH